MYKYQVNYSKRFTGGVLKGKLYHDYIRFTSAKEAQDFQKLCESGHEFSPCAGNSAYIADDVTITKLGE